jgi:hypothetical protein
MARPTPDLLCSACGITRGPSSILTILDSKELHRTQGRALNNFCSIVFCCLYMHKRYTPRRFGCTDNYHLYDLREVGHLAVMPFGKPRVPHCIHICETEICSSCINPSCLRNRHGDEDIPNPKRLFALKAVSSFAPQNIDSSQ